MDKKTNKSDFDKAAINGIAILIEIGVVLVTMIALAKIFNL